ncbi:unnamed protein product [Ectocarpus sp. 4 AP-2014]
MRWLGATGVGLLASMEKARAFNVMIQRGPVVGSPTSRSVIGATATRAAPTQRRVFMSSSPDAEDESVPVAQEPAPQPQASGGGDLTPPPGVSEQEEAELVGPSKSTVFVAGGSGFVGSEICSQLVAAGCNVIALSRKGAPANGGSWVKSVKWVEGNALNQDLYRAELRRSDTVVSCVGGFGKTDAYMGLVNGETNIKLAEAAADAGVKQFVFVSVHDYKAPSAVKKVGYFDGKRRAEKLIGELFGAKGVILKPAFIYGSRDVKLAGPKGKERTVNIPLQRVGGPLAKITSTGIGKRIAGESPPPWLGSGLPLADVAWTQPLSTAEVAKAAVRCCLEGTDSLGGGRGKDSGDAVVLKVQDMAQMTA